MKNQNLFNRLKQLEKLYNDLPKDKKLDKFLESLPAEDKEKIVNNGPCLFFNGSAEAWEKISILYDGNINTDKIIFIEDIKE